MLCCLTLAGRSSFTSVHPGCAVAVMATVGAAGCMRCGLRLGSAQAWLHGSRIIPSMCLRYSSANATSQAPAASSEATEEIVIPRRKTWSKLAVLQTLSSSTNRDPTAAHYMFQDDSYLIPRTSSEFRLYSLSKESGHNAAKYIVNTYPKFFQKDFAEPHIPCLMPEDLQPQIEEVSEAALKERIQLRRVKDSVDMFDQLLQTGTTLSVGTINCLLDLICFYGDREPPRGDQPEETEPIELEEANHKKRSGPLRRAADSFGVWRENNNAERIFSLMPEKNASSFCTMIRGMVKYGAYSKAFSMYTELQNHRLTADVYSFNALITAAPDVRDTYIEKWDLMQELLKDMMQQKVQPNLLTFNAVLKGLRRCSAVGRSPALYTLGEMKALNIEPSLASYDHLLGIFYKSVSAAKGQTDILEEVLDEIQGKSFVPKDPDDVNFFSSAMRVCLDLKDIELAYRLHDLMETGDNWKLLGDQYQQTSYYGRFFNLLCLMEHIDVVLKWYRELIPSLYYPNSRGMLDLLQALDTDNRLEVIPQIWKDIKQIGHSNKSDLVEEVLALMARDRHTPEIQAAFADTALDIKAAYEIRDKRRAPMEWTNSSLASTATLLSRAGRTEDAWKTLELFKKLNRIPSNEVMVEFLNCTKQSGNKEQAVKLVQLAANFGLQSAGTLAEKVMQDFSLSEEQRHILEELKSQSSDSSDSSDSESEPEEKS
ncbi:small ribosomal subunit protein mS39 [Pleurodeles waltl]|uniref:small ribosomal subunit protein mS39 n=1 Tax=Pleurodeles waltl TaxID=8319 RepID=UPI0037095ADB